MVVSITQAFENHALSKPDKLCIVDSFGRHTYSQVWFEICKMWKLIDDFGVKSGDRIAVECTQDAAYLEIALACHLGGFIFVPVEMYSNINRIKDICTETGAVIFFGASDYELGINCRCFTINYLSEKIVEIFASQDIIHQASSKNKLCNLDDVEEILYTTGTTGKPKGIKITYYNNIAIAENIIYGTQMAEDNVELIPLPISHSHGLRTCYAALMHGSSLVLIDGVMQVSNVVRMISDYGVTSLDLSPSAAKVLLKLAKGILSDYADQIEYIEVGTAFLDEDIKDELRKGFPNSRLYNFYGTTEAGRVCLLDFNKNYNSEGCIGRPSMHANFVIFNDYGEIIESSKDNMGLIAISGGMLTDGYWGDVKKDQSLYIDGYMKTSDIGYIDDEGFVYVFGRADDVINYKGIKIAPEEIEGPALKYPGIVDSACIPQPDKTCGYVPRLFIQVDSPDFEMDKYKIYLNNELEKSRFPKFIEVIDSIPRTFNGKLQRKKLRDL